MCKGIYNDAPQFGIGCEVISVPHNNTYTISYDINDTEHASVTTIPATSPCCEVVEFTVTISEGYDLVVKVNGTQVYAKEGTTFEIAVTSNTEIEIIVSEIVET